jgi:phosphonopyruvate decarboxylase
MGSALPAAMGVADALPGAIVVALVGDGELLMSTGTLWSISAYRPANLTIVVLANGVYGITGGQALPLPGRFVQAAESLGGIAARQVASTEGLREALAELPRPALIQAEVVHDGWPRPSPFVDPAAVRVAFRTRVSALAERRM